MQGFAATVLHETLLVPVLMYGRVRQCYGGIRRDLELGLYRWTTSGLLSIRRMDRVPNTRIRELCGVKKGLDEGIDKDVLRRFGHVERMESDRIAKRVYVGECASSRSVGRLRKRWVDTVKECLRKSFGYQASKENGAS